MKRLIVLTLVVGLFAFTVVVTAQEEKTERMQHARMMEIMQDSSLVSMMMEHIAKDDHLHQQMMQKMMAACKSDTSKMMDMCKMMMEDRDTHSMMEKMMQGDIKMLAPKTSESMKQQKMDTHEQHHQEQGSGTQSTDSAGREVLVKFKPDVKVGQINAMADEIGMQQVKEIKALNLRVFKITSGKSLEEVIQHCKNEPFVEYAEPNQTYKTQEK